VVSRSEGDGGDPVDPSSEEQGPNLFVIHPRQDEVEFNELTVRLKISYRTILLAVVIFDVTQRVIRALSDSNIGDILR